MITTAVLSNRAAGTKNYELYVSGSCYNKWFVFTFSSHPCFIDGNPFPISTASPSPSSFISSPLLLLPLLSSCSPPSPHPPPILAEGLLVLDGSEHTHSYAHTHTSTQRSPWSGPGSYTQALLKPVRIIYVALSSQLQAGRASQAATMSTRGWAPRGGG